MQHRLFLCVENSCRSQIAQARANELGVGIVQAYSAGSNPSKVKPQAIAVMEEVGISLESYTSKSLSELPEIAFDLVVTVCDEQAENCPVYLGQAGISIHRSFPDPKGSELEPYRQVRDQIHLFIEELIAAL